MRWIKASATFTTGTKPGESRALSTIQAGTKRDKSAIGSQLEAERRPPSPAEQEQLARSQAMLQPLRILVPVLLTIALAAMATARYVPLLM